MVFDHIRAANARITEELNNLDKSAMHAAGAHHAEIRENVHAIAVSTMDDAEAVRDYVEEHTSLHLHGCHPDGDGHVVTFAIADSEVNV